MMHFCWRVRAVTISMMPSGKLLSRFVRFLSPPRCAGSFIKGAAARARRRGYDVDCWFWPGGDIIAFSFTISLRDFDGCQPFRRLLRMMAVDDIVTRRA